MKVKNNHLFYRTKPFLQRTYNGGLWDKDTRWSQRWYHVQCDGVCINSTETTIQRHAV